MVKVLCKYGSGLCSVSFIGRMAWCGRRRYLSPPCATSDLQPSLPTTTASQSSVAREEARDSVSALGVQQSSATPGSTDVPVTAAKEDKTASTEALISIPHHLLPKPQGRLLPRCPLWCNPYAFPSEEFSPFSQLRAAAAWVRSWKKSACDTADQWAQTQVPSPPRDQYGVGVRCWGWHCLLLSGLALISSSLQIEVEQWCSATSITHPQEPARAKRLLAATAANRAISLGCKG